MRKHTGSYKPHRSKAAIGKVRAMQPQLPFLQAVNQLAHRIPELRTLFDKKGFLRTLTTDSNAGLFPNGIFSTPKQFSQAFLQQPEIRQGLGLDACQLDAECCVHEKPLTGWNVAYPQTVTFEGQNYKVLHGRVDVALGKDGTVYNLNSTLRHGTVAPSLTSSSFKAKTYQDAIKVAEAHVKTRNVHIEKARAEMFFSEHRRRLDPVWRVILTGYKVKKVRGKTQQVRMVLAVIVKATTGEVVGEPIETLRHIRLPKFKAPAKNAPQPKSVKEAVLQAFFVTDTGEFIKLAATGAGKPGKNKGRGRSKRTGNKEVAGKAFLQVPDPKKPEIKQIFDVIIESLPNPKVLSNENFELFIGNAHDPVQAKADGTFNYLPNDPEFSAVCTFFVLNIQWELMKLWGLRKDTKRMPVRVEDRSTVDNASADEENWEMRIGIGSGLKNGGLARYLAYDFGVSLHENGHHLLFVLAEGKDLSGPEAGAIHEAVGDIQGTQLICLWLRLKYGKQLGINITVKDVFNGSGKVGTYALPPDGIRNQRNTKKGPLVGEPHADALIVGGAMFELLIGLVKALDNVETGLQTFGTTTIEALSLLPAHGTKFRDLLNAYITADKQLNKGANRQLILDCFGNHKIKLSTARRAPVIVLR
jgi:hypothetical protein